MQGTLGIVNGSFVFQKLDFKADSSPASSSNYSKAYNPKELPRHWDILSNIACSTIKLTLSQPLTKQYCKFMPYPRLYSMIFNSYKKVTQAFWICVQDSFWNSKNDPFEDIELWLGFGRVSSDHFTTFKSLPTDQQVADCLIASIHSSWDNIKGALMYSQRKISLHEVTSALGAHAASFSSEKDEDFTPNYASSSTRRVSFYNWGKLGHQSFECCCSNSYGKN